ncbi:hypothetical protein B4U80_11322, partial [Leptotrombidium deliense]
ATSFGLHCNFDLQGDELYSVKWYKNYVEFYRYLPSHQLKTVQMFRLNGIYVDLSLIKNFALNLWSLTYSFTYTQYDTKIV